MKNDRVARGGLVEFGARGVSLVRETGDEDLPDFDPFSLRQFASALADVLEDVGDRYEGDVLGGDPVTTSHRAAQAAAEAVDGSSPDATVHLSYGEERVEEYVRQLAADHLVHGWDLAVATGADARLDPELVAEVAAWFAGREEMYRFAGVVGPHVDASGDPQTDLLAAFGRDAHWAASV